MAVHGSPLRKGGGTAQPCRMRALPLPMGEVPEAERAFLPSQSLRDSSPRVGAKGDGLWPEGIPEKGHAVSRKAMTEGIRTSIFPGIVNNRAFTIPQSQPSVRRLCQLPLHKGARNGLAVTDEGLASPFGRGAPDGAERAFLPSQSLRDSSPSVGAKGDGGAPAPVRRLTSSSWNTGYTRRQWPPDRREIPRNFSPRADWRSPENGIFWNSCCR